jgi:hypothetical protein
MNAPFTQIDIAHKEREALELKRLCEAIVTYINFINNLDLQLSLNFILSSVIHTPILKGGTGKDIDRARDDGISVQISSLCFCY